MMCDKCWVSVNESATILTCKESQQSHYNQAHIQALESQGNFFSIPQQCFVFHEERSIKKLTELY
jgi:hypothetical protein